MVGNTPLSMTRFYPEFDMDPPDEYYAEEWARRCEEEDAKAEDDLFMMMQAADKIGADWALARPMVVDIIKSLYSSLDPQNTTEAAILFHLESADRIVRVQNKAAARMIEYESDHRRDFGHP